MVKKRFRAFGVKSHTAGKHRFGRCWHAISEIRCTSRKKVPVGVWLKSTRPSCVRFCSMPNPPQAGGNIDDRGFGGFRCSRVARRPRPSRTVLSAARASLFCKSSAHGGAGPGEASSDKSRRLSRSQITITSFSGDRGPKLHNRDEISRLRTQKCAKLGPGASLVHVRSALGAGFCGFGHQKDEKGVI